MTSHDDCDGEDQNSQAVPGTRIRPLRRRPSSNVQDTLSEFYDYETSLLATLSDSLREEDPEYAPSISYLNHGAFGDPYPSTLKLRNYITANLCYRQPMVYHRSLIPSLVARAKQRACEYLKIIPSSSRQGDRYDDFSFVNVTGALFGVVQSIHFQPGDVIITSDMLYHSLTDALLYLKDTYRLEWIIVESPAGCCQDGIYDAFEHTIQHTKSSLTNNSIKLVIADHISSKPSAVFPVQRICTLCRELQIPTLIDGAHVPGSIPSRHISVPDIGPTFYAVTFHKWVNTPRGGSGGLWVNRKDIEEHYSGFIDISSLTLQGGWADKPMNGDNAIDTAPAIELYLDGTHKPGMFTDGITQGVYDESTREYENIVVLPHCLDLVQNYEEQFQHHVSKLRPTSLDLLQTVWQLDEKSARYWYGDESPRFCIPLLSIPLPTNRLLKAAKFGVADNDGNDKPTASPTSISLSRKLRLIKKAVNLKLWEDYSVEIPVFIWNGKELGVRISLGRHVTLEDIAHLGDAVNDLIQCGFAV